MIWGMIGIDNGREVMIWGMKGMKRMVSLFIFHIYKLLIESKSYSVL